MARTDTLGNFCTDIADSIREKTGETGLIPASEFDVKIKSIQGGGSAEDLTEELTTYNTELTTQETMIDDIIIALENKSSPGSGDVDFNILNIFMQADEPEIKKGLWVKTDTLKCEYIIGYSDSTNNDSHNNALIFKLNNRQRIYYTDLYNIESKTFAFTDIDYYSESTGYTQDIELYYGDDKKWILVKTPLPDEYTRISAVHNGGNAYINSGVIPNADTGFDIDFLVHSGYGPYAIFGSRVTYKSQVFQYAIWQPRTEFKGTLTVGTDTTNDGWDIRYDAGITGNIRYSTSLYSSDKYVQPSGNIVRVKSNPQINTTFPIYIACLNEGNNASEFSTVTIYSLKFYNKDIIVRNFIPVTTLVNGSEIAGLYDLIDGVFYKSSNSYNFTKVV